ncbi:hypothetical protein NPX13_g3530 [Xylaria arbuscula]|uniref:Uncharacterized protein n=1 Tax=Xylaria arbuscula TaxID=114810 RepID=A0A9W8NIB1_9PEZI|nr:hypothetical protein NPX13_g3530 [Xylaria arbuscula]
MSIPAQLVHGRASKEIPNGLLEDENDGMGIPYTKPSSLKASVSSDHHLNQQAVTAPGIPNSICKEPRSQTPPRYQPVVVPSAVVPGPVPCDTPLAQQSFPIRAKIGSHDSKKYELKAYANEPGLYYSSTTWPDELPHGDYTFLSGRLRNDLKHHIRIACMDKKNRRLMKRQRIPLTEQAFSTELRLSGRTITDTHDIELRITIWIICACDFYKKLIKDALRQSQLSWVEDEHLEVVRGLKFNKRRAQIENLDLSRGIRFMDSYRLHLHTEEAGEDNSACGLVLCATLTRDGYIVDQYISRLGGLVSLDSKKLCGISTAHGVLDILSPIVLYSTEDEDSDSSDISDPESGTEADFSTGARAEGVTKDLERSNIYAGSNITHWNPVPEVIVLGFVQMALPNANDVWTLSKTMHARDFALFRVGHNRSQLLDNSYEYQSVKHLVTTQKKDDPRKDSHSTPSSDEVIILLGHNVFTNGRLLPGTSTICMNGVEFYTTRILLDKCLVPGASGSWVVSGSCLHGIIMASYGEDPIAHMIPSQQLFRDIKSAFLAEISIDLPRSASLIGEDQKRRKPELPDFEDSEEEYEYLHSPPRPDESVRFALDSLSRPEPTIRPHELFHVYPINTGTAQPLTVEAVAAINQEYNAVRNVCEWIHGDNSFPLADTRTPDESGSPMHWSQVPQRPGSRATWRTNSSGKSSWRDRLDTTDFMRGLSSVAGAGALFIQDMSSPSHLFDEDL